ncbi:MULTISPECIES: hypothetical protein [Pseudomonas]|uniref:Uncharacterized protein n=1 Tax=Pseudomonas asplenii TaxID=53407 RepID=A0A0N0E3A1_9PSED|nr:MULTISPECIES: hypothetical protein [Pseudomonas]KPA89829.1 hypothetical protein PF66_03683 [Pseudomonas fuscovaginae]KPA98833.1 hypothetical protein PF70_01027 [Pseudomonas fuscovaginae]
MKFTSGSSSTPPSITVEFGKPSHVHHLHYQVLYKDKPFEEAALYYYDNGLYKIVSPGEEHYGVYVVRGSFDDLRYAISYISLPSSDWYGNVAQHDLSFDRETGTFEQQALLPSDQDIPRQHGRYRLESNPVADPRPLKW